MDYYHLRERVWKNQHESDDSTTSAKIPRLLLEPPHEEPPESSALPLFVSDQQLSNRISNLSALPDSSTTTTTTSRVSRGMIGLFSLAQWQELELQAMIFKYMLAGAAIPSELLQPIKKSLLNTPFPPPFYLHHPLEPYPHYHPTMLQSGYWGRTTVDPEPGRCRRTDGKKWRCSKDVVSGQKYCERHMHRGRNRSRKPVEIPTRPTSTVTIASVGGGASGGNGSNLIRTTTTTTTPSPVAALPITSMSTNNGGNPFILSSSSSSPSMDLLHLNQRYSKNEPRNNDNNNNNILDGGRKSDGQVLRHFFDDWPKESQQQTANGRVTRNSERRTSSTCLSISIEGGEDHHNHHRPSSDFSLKLSTGNGDDDESRKGSSKGERLQLINWGGMSNSMGGGGPLAEALRSSSTSTSSPTSVLPLPPHGCKSGITK